MSWHRYGSHVQIQSNTVMTEERSFALIVISVPQSIYFWVCIRQQAFKKYNKISTGKQDSTEILMAFASDFIWRKSVS